MQRIRFIGLALVAPFAFSGVATASASAHEFVASVVPGNLKGKALNTHKFKTKAGTGECKVANVVEAGSKVVESPAKTQEVELEYKECEVPGLGTATVSNAKYAFSAELTKDASLKNTVTVKASICTVTVEPVTANQGLEKVEYANLAGPPEAIEVKSTVTGITYKTSSFCPGGAVTASDGEYTGKEKVEETGGNVKWL